jgi:hypothetical protein
MLIFAILFALTLGVPMSPKQLHCPSNQHELSGGVFICSKPNFQGLCTYLDAQRVSQCHSWSSENDRPQSIGPDSNTLCNLYKSSDCTGKAVKPWAQDSIEQVALETPKTIYTLLIICSSVNCPGISNTGWPVWYTSFKCISLGE